MAGAIELFEQAVAIDPGFAPALGWAAVCHTRFRLDGYAEDPETSRRKAKSLAERALARPGGDPGVLANVAMTLGDDENAEITSAIALIDQSLALNPSSARAWFISGLLRVLAGECDEAIKHVETCLRLSPRDPVGVPLYIVERRGDARCSRAQRVVVDDQDLEIRERAVARRRQGQLVTDPLHQLVGSGDDRQLERQIGGVAGRFGPLHHQGVGVRPPILEFRMSPGGRQAGDVERLLDGHRQPEQRPVLAARKRRIGGGARPIEIAHNDGVDLGVERLDAGDRAVDQLARRNLPTGERRHQLAGGAVCQPRLIGGRVRLGGRQGSCGGSRADRGDERAPAWFAFHSGISARCGGSGRPSGRGPAGSCRAARTAERGRRGRCPCRGSGRVRSRPRPG